MFLVQKIIQLAIAALLLIFAIVRIAFIESETFTGFMISVYWVIFGVIFILVELNVKKSRMWFNFLNSSLGKGLFHVFLFLSCFGSGASPIWVDVLLAVILAFTAPIFFVMTYDRKRIVQKLIVK